MYISIRDYNLKKWDFSNEGKICPCCKGTGQRLEHQTSHTSEGLIPCPLKYFQGHGYPTCGDDGKLHFSKCDIENESELKEKKY